MFFGKRDVTTELGVFSSEKCRACKHSFSYRFLNITRYIVALFINLIPVRSHYQAVCTECGDTVAVDGKAGAKLAAKHFGKKRRALIGKNVLRLAAATAILAAAITLPLAIRLPLDRSPQAVKALVSDGTYDDGTYYIQDADGEMLGVVEISDGVSTLTYYDQISVLTGEAGTERQFIKHEYRQEATNDTAQDELFLVRVADDPGILEDSYGTAVRMYHYDTQSDTLGYSLGVTDLSAIEYGTDKVVYPFTHFSSEDGETSYFLVLYLMGDKRLEAKFMPASASSEPDRLTSLTVRELKGGCVVSETLYYFDTTTVSLATQAGLTHESAGQDILSFLEENAPEPLMTYTYSYYDGTGVVDQSSVSLPDSNGDMQTFTQTFTVTEKNGYYIVQADEE